MNQIVHPPSLTLPRIARRKAPVNALMRWTEGRAPVRIGASACPHDCPSTCALEVEVLDERTIGRMEQMYAPELATLDPVPRKSLLIALEALTDFESWARARHLYGLSFEEACELWTTVIDRLLPPSPPHPQ